MADGSHWSRGERGNTTGKVSGAIRPQAPAQQAEGVARSLACVEGRRRNGWTTTASDRRRGRYMDTANMQLRVAPEEDRRRVDGQWDSDGGGEGRASNGRGFASPAWGS
ncbi:hypothetical protein ANO11243_005170 [Dothideomycetidae sp. 11243]|nr:hypothetical protein ANO11243_005170 [fungal sp. No.11243]